MCTVLLPPCVNPTAVNKYIDINTMNKICVWTEYVIFLDDSSTWRFQRGGTIHPAHTANTVINTLYLYRWMNGYKISLESCWLLQFWKHCTPPTWHEVQKKNVWEPEYTCSMHTALIILWVTSRELAVTRFPEEKVSQKAKQWTLLIGIIHMCK